MSFKVLVERCIGCGACDYSCHTEALTKTDEFLGLFQQELGPVSGPSITETSMLYHQAMADLDELYKAYRGTGPSIAERRAWGRDLAVKMFVRNEDARATLVYIEFALRRETGG